MDSRWELRENVELGVRKKGLSYSGMARGRGEGVLGYEFCWSHAETEGVRRRSMNWSRCCGRKLESRRSPIRSLPAGQNKTTLVIFKYQHTLAVNVKTITSRTGPSRTTYLSRSVSLQARARAVLVRLTVQQKRGSETDWAWARGVESC